MKKERTTILGILITDVLLLLATIGALFAVYDAFFPGKIVTIMSRETIVLCYLISFLMTYSFLPPVMQERISRVEDVVSQAISTGLLNMLMATLVIVLVRQNENFPRGFVFTFFIVFTIVLVIERLISRKVIIKIRSMQQNKHGIIIIGREHNITELYHILSNKNYGYDIRGIFYKGEAKDPNIQTLKQGEEKDVCNWLLAHEGIKEIYACISPEQHIELDTISRYCDNNLIRLFYIPPVDILGGSVTMSYVDNIPLIARRNEPLSLVWNKLAKRTFDIIFSLTFLVLLFPWIFIIVSIMIKIQSPGPIFFKQKRTGIDGKIFTCYKFRTMHVNDMSDSIQATKNDPRKFPFGNFMRHTSIDELPQFINVLCGDMSVVGPRPHMLKHTEEYSHLVNGFMVRHLAKPGITGLAQISGYRGEIKNIDHMENRVKRDVEYIENWTLLLDLKIIAKTVINVCCGEKNAY